MRAKQVQDIEVLLRLRHHAVIGGYLEDHQIDPMRSGQHVADEALVPGHIDDSRARRIRQREVREAEIDRDAALLLFLEPVGVLTGQRLDQSGLSVIDMTGCPDDRGRTDGLRDGQERRRPGPDRGPVWRAARAAQGAGGEG